MSQLDTLKNHAVESANFIEDYIQIRFSSNIVLNIHNEVSISGREFYNPEIIIDRVVKEIMETPEKISIIFKNNLILDIDLRDEAYSGPEAIELIVPGKAMVVWN